MEDVFVTRTRETVNLLSQVMSNKGLTERIEETVSVIVSALKLDKPLLVCGNGGSSSDALHIAGELVGRFLVERKACNVIALSANSSVLTAWANDYAYNTIFSRQVEAHGCNGGVLWGISTSGNSENVILALKQAKVMGMKTIGLTGDGGGAMAESCDILVDVPSKITPRIQELHIVIYHYICEMVESKVSQ